MFSELVVLRGRENEIINSAGNTPDIEEKHDNGNINNIAAYKGETLNSLVAMLLMFQEEI